MERTYRQNWRAFFREGEPMVWLSALGLSVVVAMVVGFLLVVLANGIGFYWASPLELFELRDGRRYLGEVWETREDAEEGVQYRVKIGNRDLYGHDFVWISETAIKQRHRPDGAAVLERREHGDFFGFLRAVEGETEAPWMRLPEARATAEQLQVPPERIAARLSSLSQRFEALTDRRQAIAYALQTGEDPEAAASLAELEQRLARLSKRMDALVAEQRVAEQRAHDSKLIAETVDGQRHAIAVADLTRAYRPNDMGFGAKLGLYASKMWELVSEEPRESNTEGGVFPAIFGTVMMVFLMSIVVMPLGVIAAIYLRVYARQGRLVQFVRSAVYNLAGVPSIVYGVFGLGFFIYGIGGAIDALFYPHKLPEPTFGTGGILWASVTLALLTLPVVVVSTEEALEAVPDELKQASLALGATRLQTLLRILVPMATPGILTGFVLAIARAAGEVAPLMLTGAVKLAPALPVDGVAPYLHLDRKFMHLGFHIYDLGFQSPDIEAVLPMVYITTTLLLGIVIVLSSAAMVLRHVMRNRYRVRGF